MTQNRTLKDPLVQTLTHLVRRATGAATEAVPRAAVEEAVRSFMLAPAGSRCQLAKAVVAETAAIIVADLVQSRSTGPAAGTRARPHAAATPGAAAAPKAPTSSTARSAPRSNTRPPAAQNGAPQVALKTNQPAVKKTPATAPAAKKVTRKPR